MSSEDEFDDDGMDQPTIKAVYTLVTLGLIWRPMVTVPVSDKYLQALPWV